jgi:hypothetical protein
VFKTTGPLPNLQQRYNAAPTQSLPTVLRDRESGGPESGLSDRHRGFDSASAAGHCLPAVQPYGDKHMRSATSVGLAAALLSMPLPAGAATLYSKTFYAKPIACNGTDQLGFIELPWEPVPIVIVGVSVSHMIQAERSFLARLFGLPETSHAYAAAGSSNEADGDILSPHVIGDASETLMYPPGTGFDFPAAGGKAPPHIDVHLYCTGAGNHQAWVTVFYTKRDAATAAIAP